MSVEATKLLQIIGAKEVEITLLREHVASLSGTLNKTEQETSKDNESSSVHRD